MSALFVVLVAGCAFFSGLALFDTRPRQSVRRAGRWSPKTRLSLRARLRRT
ncbi:MAG: hypothetical protein QM723_23065 [Myxococcaceae bacterium]